jgi:SAM-dependent methyltransferase
MEAHTDPRFWNEATGKRFTHPLDISRLAGNLTRDARVLDYGCGQGRLCSELISHGYSHGIGVDSSPEMIRIAHQRNPAASFFVNDGRALPVAGASLDAILLFAVLTCIPSDEAQRSLVHEFKRVLRPGGLLLVSDYPLQQDQRNLARYAEFAHQPGGYGSFRLPEGAMLRHHRREWFRELLADFVVEHEQELKVLTMNGNPARIVQLWTKKPA